MSDPDEADRSAIERALWGAFVSRAILPGQVVIVDAFAHQLGVPAPAIRTVLVSMARRGLVTSSTPGVFEARALLSDRELAEIFVVRNRLEPWLAEEAARADTPADAATYLLALADVPPSPTLTALAERDTAFHNLVGELSGLRFAGRAARTLNSPFHIYRRLDGHSHAPASDNEHVSIAQAIIAGDTELARVTMQRHLSASSARLIALG